MNRTSFLAGLLVVVALIAATTGPACALDLDDARALMRNHQMVDLSGAPVSLADHQGEVLVVNFWASWCAPCLRELPILDQWNTTWQNRGARVIAVSIDSKARNARSFVEKQGLGLTVWLDGPQGLAAQLDLSAVPTSYVIDREGRVVLRIEGSSPTDLARMQEKVQSLLRETDRRPEA